MLLDKEMSALGGLEEKEIDVNVDTFGDIDELGMNFRVGKVAHSVQIKLKFIIAGPTDEYVPLNPTEEHADEVCMTCCSLACIASKIKPWRTFPEQIAADLLEGLQALKTRNAESKQLLAPSELVGFVCVELNQTEQAHPDSCNAYHQESIWAPPPHTQQQAWQPPQQVPTELLYPPQLQVHRMLPSALAYKRVCSQSHFGRIHCSATTVHASATRLQQSDDALGEGLGSIDDFCRACIVNFFVSGRILSSGCR